MRFPREPPHSRAAVLLFRPALGVETRPRDRLPFPVCRVRTSSGGVSTRARAVARTRNMPTINKRFLLKILLVLFASTGILFAAHAVQAKRIPAALKLQ